MATSRSLKKCNLIDTTILLLGIYFEDIMSQMVTSSNIKLEAAGRSGPRGLFKALLVSAPGALGGVAVTEGHGRVFWTSK